MDDEALARSLQAEEIAAARHAQASQGGLADSNKAAIMGMINNGLRQAQSVEDPVAQAQARSVVPFEQLRRDAQATADLNAQLGVAESAAGTGAVGADDLLVQGLLAWFKRSFFTWVDSLPCSVCGSPTRNVGMAAPTPEEAAHGAGRVEQHGCPVCQHVTRFPRYTDPRKLLETRRGRCGEWAHTFLLLLRAAGLDARHVCDNADHVWCEYYSHSLCRWVHVDACEEAWDKPLLYEGGWGKTLEYVIATSRHGATDVTRRYVLQPGGFSSRRTLVPEAWLLQTLSGLTSQLRSGLDQATRRQLAVRDASEALQLMSLEDGQAAAAAAGLPGRQSGAAGWRAARGETGASGSTPANSRPCTPYGHAPDTNLPPLFSSAGRLTGGVCRASGDNKNEAVGCLFDGCLASKWLDFGGGGAAGSAWVEYRLLPSASPVVVSHYDLVSAEDCPERDPCDWVLECIPATAAAGNETAAGDTGAAQSASSSSSSSDNGRWIEVDRRSSQRFSRRHQLRSYAVLPATRIASRQWRLRITRTANPAAANSVQLACWCLYSSSQASAQLAKQAEGQQQQQQNNQHQQQETTSLAPAAGSQLLYLSIGMKDSLSSLLAKAADNGGEGSEEISQEAVGTFKRIMSNLQQHPNELKYWQLSGTASKVQAVLQAPLLLAAIFEAGFRPVIGQQQGGGTTPAQQLRLLADEQGAMLPAVLSLLPQAG